MNTFAKPEKTPCSVVDRATPADDDFRKPTLGKERGIRLRLSAEIEGGDRNRCLVTGITECGGSNLRTRCRYIPPGVRNFRFPTTPSGARYEQPMELPQLRQR